MYFSSIRLSHLVDIKMSKKRKKLKQEKEDVWHRLKYGPPPKQTDVYDGEFKSAFDIIKETVLKDIVDSEIDKILRKFNE